MATIDVAEHLGEVAGEPESVALRVRLADGVEGGDFLVHGAVP